MPHRRYRRDLAVDTLILAVLVPLLAVALTCVLGWSVTRNTHHHPTPCPSVTRKPPPCTHP